MLSVQWNEGKNKNIYAIKYLCICLVAITDCVSWFHKLFGLFNHLPTKACDALQMKEKNLKHLSKADSIYPCVSAETDLWDLKTGQFAHLSPSEPVHWVRTDLQSQLPSV